MATLRELKARIGSVASSQKITGAMKMISSAKMHKAEQSLRRLQPYRKGIEDIIANLLGADTEFTSPLMTQRPVNHITIVVFGSDDGLCGAYNVNIFKILAAKLQEMRDTYGTETPVTIYPIGKKMLKAVSRLKSPTVDVRTKEGVDSKTTGEGVKVFVDYLKERFEAGETDKVDFLYMNFKSVSRQRPLFGQLLPVTQEAFAPAGAVNTCKPYIFEPSATAIFNTALPMLLLAVMQDIFTENRASEQAARVMAMQSANDNATKLLEQLQLEYNKLRQQSITTELLDILGGQIR
ncbi:MAG: ATP synthase F1 subunit gamma [Paramuribaculum sp.]|nr:ATP synthase F1 subunit gamma [Paramuribaculum sp.]